LKLKLIKSDYQKDQIKYYTRIGSPVQTKADSKFMNPDPIQNDRINVRNKNTESKLENIIENLNT